MKAGILIIICIGGLIASYLFFIFGVQPLWLSIIAVKIKLIFPEDAIGLYGVQFESNSTAKVKSMIIDFSQNRVLVGDEYSSFLDPIKIKAFLISGVPLPVAFQGEADRQGKLVWVLNAPLRNERYFFVGNESEFETFLKNKGPVLYGL